MINRIYNVLKFLTNNDVHGNVSPTRFNTALYDVIVEQYESYYSTYQNILNRENKGLITRNGATPNKIIEQLNYYLKVDVLPMRSVGVLEHCVELPSDHRFTDYISKKGFEVEILSNSSEYNAVARSIYTKPTEKNPIGLRVDNKIYILPSNDLEIGQPIVTIHYLRNPKVPNWTYVTIPADDGGVVEIFNPSDPNFQDVDMHISEEHNITIKLLKSFGIHLKDAELTKLIDNEEFKEFQKEQTL